jgi:hypothetical protein
MDDILDYARIEKGLLAEMKRQTQLTEDTATTGDRLVEADLAWTKKSTYIRIAYRALKDEDGKRYTEGAIEDLARSEAWDEYEEWQRAKMAHPVVKVRLSTANNRADELRSLMASHRKLTD